MAGAPVLIRRTSTVEEADIIVAWLEERGIEAVVADRDNPGVLAFGVTDVEGIEVYARDAETAARAQTLLAEHDSERSDSPAPAESRDPIDVTCDECGAVCSFPADTSRLVEECPECGAYVDTSGMGDVDLEEPEAEPED
ncbi:MAG: hypothetical protein ACE5HE_03410 [Phycisphaerae bacterium]